MSARSKKIIADSLRSEIGAFERAITASGGKRDYFGDRQFDTREAYLADLRRALRELDQVRAAA